MNVCESLTRTSKLFPNKTAIIFDGQEISYSELERASVGAAVMLRDAGIEKGDRVALMLPNAPSFAIWYYGVLRLGAIAVSVSTRLAAGEVEFITSDCGARAFVTDAVAMNSVGDSLPEDARARLAVDDVRGLPVETRSWPQSSEQSWYEADPNEAALILYTSGTTGFPKGATLSHANVRSNVCAFNHLCNMRTEDRVLLAVPLFHCFGQNALLNSVLNVGGTIVLQQRFDLNESKRLIQTHRVTQLYGVPMMFSLWHQACEPEELASVNYCFSAAATLPLQTSEAWREKFDMPIHEGYGLTETSPFATYNHRNKYVPGSIGAAIDSVEIKTVDTETGQTCAANEPGEIAIRGPNVMLGYWNRPEETAKSIRDGWFYSGDIGQIDNEGYLHIVDRVKDMITVGGLKVFPAEVERVLLDHPSVAEAAVVGAPDAMFGEQVVAFIVLSDDSDRQTAIEQIQEYAKTHLGSYKLPRRLIAVESLPRNPSGKVLKTKLREQITQDDAVEVGNDDDPVTEQTSSIRPARLRSLLAKVHQSEKLRTTVEFLQQEVRETCDLNDDPNPQLSFVEAGLDSLAMVSLATQLQVEIGSQKELPPTLLFDQPRLVDLAEFLVGLFSELDDTKPRKTTPGSTDDQSKPNKAPETKLQAEVEQMSEEEALAELMRELH